MRKHLSHTITQLICFRNVSTLFPPLFVSMRILFMCHFLCTKKARQWRRGEPANEGNEKTTCLCTFLLFHCKCVNVCICVSVFDCISFLSLQNVQNNRKFWNIYNKIVEQFVIYEMLVCVCNVLLFLSASSFCFCWAKSLPKNYSLKYLNNI